MCVSIGGEERAKRGGGGVGKGGGGWGGGGGEGGWRDGLHASRTAGPVAVVEFEAFALEDECADAVLWGWGACC